MYTPYTSVHLVISLLTSVYMYAVYICIFGYGQPYVQLVECQKYCQTYCFIISVDMLVSVPLRACPCCLSQYEKL